MNHEISGWVRFIDIGCDTKPNVQMCSPSICDKVNRHTSMNRENHPNTFINRENHMHVSELLACRCGPGAAMAMLGLGSRQHVVVVVVDNRMRLARPVTFSRVHAAES